MKDKFLPINAPDGSSSKQILRHAIGFMKINFKKVSLYFMGLISILSQMGSSAHEAVPYIINLLDDEDSKREAIIALGNIGETAKSALPSLEKFVRQDAQNDDFKGLVNDAINKIKGVSSRE